MRLRHLLPGALVGTALLPAVAGGGAPGLPNTPHSATERARVPRAGLPIPFEPNAGQTDPRVSYLARGRGFVLFLAGEEAVCALRDGGILRMRLAGEATRSTFEPEAGLPGVSNYFLGNDPARWRSGVPHFRSVLREEARPGVDLRWRGDRGGLEYEVILAAGARHRSVSFEVEGAEGIEVEPGGALLVRTRRGVLRHSRPVAFQKGVSGECRVPARFVPSGAGGFRIEAGPCDPALPLVVDPRLEYSTYLGSSQYEYGTCIAADSTGAAYVAGSTQSTSFPTASPYQGTNGGGYDAFVTKFDAAGSSLVYSTYMGGSADEYSYGVGVDSDGSAYVVGNTKSLAYPTQNAIQATLRGGYDGFLTKLSASGSQLVYSTFIGGYVDDHAFAIAVDSAGAAYVGGTTASAGFPDWGNIQGTRYEGTTDGFIVKVASSGSSVTYARYLAGSGAEYVNDIAVDSAGAAYLAGQTNSTNFPLQGAFQTTFGGNYDGYVAKLNAAGSSVLYSSYLGGPGYDNATAIAVDGNGLATVVGSAGATGFPTQSPLYGTFGGGGSDAVVSRVAADGASLTFSSYFGGAGADEARDVSLDSTGAAHVAGFTSSSTGFPLASAHQGTYGGGTYDAFLFRMNASATSLIHSTYLGGAGEDQGRGVAAGGTDSFVVGTTTSSDFPTQAPYQGSSGGGVYDAFVLRFASTPLPPGDLDSFLYTSATVRLIWTDNSADETGFQIERKVGSGAYATLATVAAGTELYDDAGLSSGTRYTYRVRAINDDGVSAWSGETTRTTPTALPGVPLTPSALTATVVSGTRIDLAWADESTDETYFKIQRRTGSGAWEDQSTPSPNVTSAIDDEVLPGRNYSYRIRAANALGFSDYSEPVSASTPDSVDVLLEKGLVKDVEALGKDRASLRGTLALNGDSPDGAFDPSTDGFEVRLGGSDGTPLAGAPGGDEGWVLKDGRHTWKSPKGSSSKVKVVVDTVAGTWSVSVRKGQFASVPENPIPVWMAVGDDAGSQSFDWRVTTGKAVVYRYP